MKSQFPSRPASRGYISYIMVLSVGSMLTVMTLSAYKYAGASQTIQKETQLRVDYQEKEDAILRGIVNIVPNRAMRAMQSGSNTSGAVRDSLRWKNIFSDALDQAGARSSISSALATQIGGSKAVVANSGDVAVQTDDLKDANGNVVKASNIEQVFDAIDPETGFVSAGIGRSLGTGFPAPLETSNSNVTSRDPVYPIISTTKEYRTLAQSSLPLPVSTYPLYNRVPYPEIRFGYCSPGQLFVAKRNWWAFSMHLGEHGGLLKSYARGDSQVGERDFILSIYEIPSQLAISAEAFTKIGTHADGTPWQHANIQGGIYATRAQVDSGMHVDRLMARRGLALGSDVTVGANAIDGNPLTPGVREKYEVTTGAYMPVALASESGRAAFVSINRGADYFDRFAHTNETSVLSPTTWNNYSVGALQCAMRLDIKSVVSSTNRTPTELRFEYMKAGARVTLNVPLTAGPAPGLPTGYIKVADEGQTYNFGTQLVDVAYGTNSSYVYKTGVTGNITFNNATFTDPVVGTLKYGYFRPTYPFEVKMLQGTKPCIAVYPERFKAFLTSLGADGLDVNHSLAINVDYTTTGINMPAYKPSIPCTNNDYGVLMTECDDLTPFTKGFSLVTNLRLYIGDDFNVVSTPPPAGSGLPTPFYPPASLFAPEKRYGTDFDPLKVEVAGQMGHLKGDDGSGTNPVHLLDFKMASEANAAAANIDVNLRPITHPAELPPVTMMNWLVVIEERRKMFYSGAGAN
ncbi:hypothetical protein OKA05_03640 [Luteolibacter arcticus]|uniref:Flp pilus-assembly TadG-like N-terminal domain-containing protein n=1 Tax=Luteolibacter arcticus TaxID=1581411 RepID=A0ABT3GDC7_9BACT|nr:hypothetical protein [Luteolibacter arcticus]MCW1921630.1 hypothetical protein [Luteolibacter arcticus]